MLALAPRANAGPLSEWLARPDPLQPCPTLVVLNGEHPARADEAARLYHAGTGREIWLTDDPGSADHVSDVGTRSNHAHLVARGVPAAAITVVPGVARGTRAELAVIAAALRQRALSCAVLITSPLHVRRVRVTWRGVADDSPRAIVHGAPGGTYGAGWAGEAKELALTFFAWIGVR